MKKRIGILLAGGKSRRYGSPKAFATLKGEEFYAITYNILANSCDEVIIVTREEFIGWFPNEYHVIVDVEQYRGCGPLAGIYSAMVEDDAEQYVVLPCDMPLLENALIKRLIHYHQMTITTVVAEGKLQPLVSVWSHRMLPVIKRALDQKQYKMTDVLDGQDVKYVDGSLLTNDVECFLNVNTSEQDKEMRKWYKS